MSAANAGLDLWTRWWLVASVVCGAALVVAAFTVSAYDGTKSQTLVQANGVKVIFIIVLPLVGALVAIGSIVARRMRGRMGVGIFTWLIVGALGALTMLGVLTIGPFIAPVPVCLFIALLRIQENGKVKQ